MFHTGDQIGSYSLMEKLGKGAFGEVWLAEEKTAISAHKAALKLPNEADVDLDAIRQEADVWEQVKGHPNILPIIKADIYEGQIYIASEYAPDGSLSEWLKNHGGKAPTVEIAVEMTKGILAGLEHLHSKGVIHRDLKPANILLQADTPRIADFGIARLIKADAATGTTMSAGTPSYMAPECFYGVRSAQTDIWAVGVLFHKLLTGKLPFSHPDQVSVMNAILNGEPDIDSQIPEYLQRIIRKALEKDTAARYQTAAEMHQGLNKFNPAILEDEDTIPEPVVAATSAAAPVFDKEEETIVRRKAAATVPPTPQVVSVQPIEYERRSNGGRKVVAIALTSFLVLLALTAWAALHFSGSAESETRPGFSDLSNQSNRSSNLTIDRSLGGSNSNLFQNRTNGVGSLEERRNPESSVSIPGSQNPSSIASDEANPSGTTGESEQTPAATPFSIQPDEITPGVNRPARTPRSESTSTNGDDAPPPISRPAKTAAPIEIEPDAAPTPVQRPRNRPTPRSQPQTDDTPPPPPSGEKRQASEEN